MYNYTLCVQLHAVCTITRCVYNYIQRFLSRSKWKNCPHFSPALLIALVTFMRYGTRCSFLFLSGTFSGTPCIWRGRSGQATTAVQVGLNVGMFIVYVQFDVHVVKYTPTSTSSVLCILLSPHWYIIIMKLRFSLELPLNLPQHQEQRKSGGLDWWQSTRRWRSQHLTRWSPTSPPADNHSPVVGRLFDFVPRNKIFEDSIVRMLDLF